MKLDSISWMLERTEKGFQLTKLSKQKYNQNPNKSYSAQGFVF